MSERGVQLPFRLADFLSGAYYAVAISLVLVGLIVWSVTQQKRVDYLEEREREHPTKSELVEVAARVENRISGLESRTAENPYRTEAITAALRKLDLVGSRQEEMFRRVDALERERGTQNQLIAQTEIMSAEIKRLEEQQVRIIQALDNTYNTLQEALRGGHITRQPTPGNKPLPGPYPP